MESFAMNARIDDPYHGLLTKLPFSTGDLKDIVKKRFCHEEMLVWNRDFL